jgi:hypothetical protein
MNNTSINFVNWHFWRFEEVWSDDPWRFNEKGINIDWNILASRMRTASRNASETYNEEDPKRDELTKTSLSGSKKRLKKNSIFCAGEALLHAVASPARLVNTNL